MLREGCESSFITKELIDTDNLIFFTFIYPPSFIWIILWFSEDFIGDLSKQSEN